MFSPRKNNNEIYACVSHHVLECKILGDYIVIAVCGVANTKSEAGNRAWVLGLGDRESLGLSLVQ